DGVGVEDLVAVAQEGAHAGLLADVVDPPGLPGGGPLVAGPAGVAVGHDRRVERDVEVVVEVAAVRGGPGEGPAPFLPVGGQIRVAPARARRERGVGGGQVGPGAGAEVVGHGGAAAAAPVPRGVE